jgi:thiamine-monophosphate kinase
MDKSVRKLGEFGLIDRIRGRVKARRPVLVGIGDDAAVLKTNPKWLTLMTTDMLVEGRHFRLGEARPEEIGWKAMAVNLSDIAAMGGRPTAAVIAVGLPEKFPLRSADALYEGLAKAADRFGVAIAGGDTNASDRLVIAVTLLGEVEPARAVLRSGARAGDAVWVTGSLGGSLKSRRHLHFVPRVDEARWLVSHFKIRAMMDLSDGLSSDLRRMAAESRTGFRIEAGRIPVAAGSDLSGALSDGEDFELLFTLSAAESEKLAARKKPMAMRRIGTAVPEKRGITLVDEEGREKSLLEKGFDHFSA